MKIFYTYLWLRHNGSPYYVGKGHGRRAYMHHTVVRRPTDPQRILVQEFPFEADALVAEKFLIMYYGRVDLGTGILLNLTDGGEGSCNPSLEVRQKRSMALKGRITTEETRRKMSASQQGPRPWMRGKKRPLETSERIRQRALGRKASLETRRKMSLAHKGKVLPPRTSEFCRKMSETKKKIIFQRNADGTFVRGAKLMKKIA